MFIPAHPASTVTGFILAGIRRPMTGTVLEVFDYGHGVGARLVGDVAVAVDICCGADCRNEVGEW